jgi:hypothetical protein
MAGRRAADRREETCAPGGGARKRVVRSGGQARGDMMMMMAATVSNHGVWRAGSKTTPASLRVVVALGFAVYFYPFIHSGVVRVDHTRVCTCLLAAAVYHAGVRPIIGGGGTHLFLQMHYRSIIIHLTMFCIMFRSSST